MNKNDKKSAVIEVQRCLRTLKNAGMDIDNVAQSGVYDNDTANAVRQFQGMMGIPITGYVDLVTWNILMDETGKALKKTAYPLPVNIFAIELNNGGSLSMGDKGHAVSVCQMMLQNFTSLSEGDDIQNVNGIFDGETDKNVKQFQTVYLLPVTGIVDNATWNEMASFITRRDKR